MTDADVEAALLEGIMAGALAVRTAKAHIDETRDYRGLADAVSSLASAVDALRDWRQMSSPGSAEGLPPRPRTRPSAPPPPPPPRLRDATLDPMRGETVNSFPGAPPEMLPAERTDPSGGAIYDEVGRIPQPDEVSRLQTVFNSRDVALWRERPQNRREPTGHDQDWNWQPTDSEPVRPGRREGTARLPFPIPEHSWSNRGGE